MRANSNGITAQVPSFHQTAFPVVAACHYARVHGLTVSFVNEK